MDDHIEKKIKPQSLTGMAFMDMSVYNTLNSKVSDVPCLSG